MCALTVEQLVVDELADVAPPLILTSPPLPEVPVPTESAIDPPVPSVATPVFTVMEPDDPRVVEPDWKNTSPLFPSAPPMDDLIVMAPLVVSVPCPLVIVIAPPVDVTL